jgi:hypothetical protein
MSRIGSLLRALATAVAIAAASPALALPDFVPSPGGIYVDFTALVEPRTELPLGALWIQDYGPTGEGAAADNIAVVRSLTGVTINRDTQLSLFSGILNLFGLDPSYRSRVSVRLSDVTIHRVKDLSKLAGPTGEPRLYEALKAGAITITTESNLGLDLDLRAAAKLPVIGRADTGRSRSFAIDGKDMFIAYRVVTLKSSVTKEEEVPLKPVPAGAEAIFEGYRIKIDSPDPDTCVCSKASAEQITSCEEKKPLALFLEKLGAPAAAQPPTPVPASFSPGGQSSELTLPVPKADGRGGLHTSMRVRIEGARADPKRGNGAGQCTLAWGRKSRIIASLHGTRIETLEKADAPGW